MASLLYEANEIINVYAMGGIGKTTLISLYLTYLLHPDLRTKITAEALPTPAYTHLIWLRQLGTLRATFANSQDLLNYFQIEQKQEEESKFAQLMQHLAGLEGKNCLLIDNIEIKGEQDEETLRQLNTLIPQWKILLTSRSKIYLTKGFSLGFLSEQEAITLFQQYYLIEKNEQKIKNIVNHAGKHTLLIELLAKTATYNDWNLDKLQQKLKNKGLDIDQEIEIEVQHSHKTQKVENIQAYLHSIFEIVALNKEEQDLLRLFICLPTEFYSEFWCQYLFIKENTNDEKERIAKTLQNLAKKGWLNKELISIEGQKEPTYQLHYLLKEVLKEKIGVIYDKCEILVINFAFLLNVDDTKQDYIEKFNLIPYADCLLATLAQANELKKATALSELQNNLALIHIEAGNYTQARDLLLQSLEICIQVYEKNNSEVAIRQSNLATVYQDLGNYTQARDLLEQALASDIINFGEKHPTVARSQSNLASVYKNLGDYAQARDLLVQALASDIANFGEKHPTVARSQSNLASVYQSLGDYAQARDLLVQALASDIANFGEKHPTVAIRQSNLAVVYQNLGDYAQAKDLLVQALASDITNFGENHPTVAICQSNLASVYKNLGDYTQARDLLVQALASDIANFGEKHPTIARSQSNLASVYKNLGNYAQARDLLMQALASDIANFGEKHPTVAIRQLNLGGTYYYLQDYVQAKTLVKSAWLTFKATLPENHPYIVGSFSSLLPTIYALEGMSAADFAKLSAEEQNALIWKE